MLFRDQSSNIAKKYRSSSRSRSDTGSDKTSAANSGFSSTSSKMVQSMSPNTPPTGLSPQITPIATTFLLNTYINGSHFSYLPSLYEETQSNSLLSDMTKMTALASFARETSQLRVLDLARKNYDRSLMRLASALRDPDLAIEDDTLASIQLLTLYEHLANDSGCAINHAWSKHALGALPILQLRGPSQFNTPIARALFKQARDNVLLYCIQDRIHFPQSLVDLQLVVRSNDSPVCDYDVEQASWDFQPITTAFCNYNASRTQQPNTNPWTLISDALAIDSAVEQYGLSLPMDWQFQIVSIMELESHTDQGLFFAKTVHIYPSHRIAQMWNSIRMMRATLHDHILADIASLEQQGLEAGSFSQIESLRTASQIIRKQQCEEICASVSQWLVNSQHRQPYSIAAGYFVVWPMFLAAQYQTDTCNEFAIRVLSWLGRELKIRSAAMAAEKLANGQFWEGWLHVCHTF